MPPLPQSDVDDLVSFSSDDAVYIDGLRGVHNGIEAIRAGFTEAVHLVPSTSVDIKKLVADGGTVMVWRVDNFDVGGKPFALEIAAVFDAAHPAWATSRSTGSPRAPAKAGCNSATNCPLPVLTPEHAAGPSTP